MGRKVRESGTYRTAEAVRMRNELRTRPDVESGIRVDEEAGGTRILSYEPGNGRRYGIVLTDLAPLRKAEQAIGSDGGALAYVSNYGRGVILPEGEPVHYHAVQAALRCSVFDAVVLAEMLGRVLGEECTTVDQFMQEMAG
jgi:hypothetical protein